MGIGGISPGSLLLIFLIALLIFGSERIKHLGRDLGQALKGFKEGLNGVSDPAKNPHDPTQE